MIPKGCSGWSTVDTASSGYRAGPILSRSDCWCVPTWRGPDTAESMQRWIGLGGTCVWERGKTLLHFTVGDYVMVARVSRRGKHRKLMSTCTGPWRVANEDKEHVYAVQHLVTTELRDVHVARMRL